MIACSIGLRCNGWVHPYCVGMRDMTREEAKNLSPDFVCPFCKASLGPGAAGGQVNKRSIAARKRKLIGAAGGDSGTVTEHVDVESKQQHQAATTKPDVSPVPSTKSEPHAGAADRTAAPEPVRTTTAIPQSAVLPATTMESNPAPSTLPSAHVETAAMTSASSNATSVEDDAHVLEAVCDDLVSTVVARTSPKVASGQLSENADPTVEQAHSAAEHQRAPTHNVKEEHGAKDEPPSNSDTGHPRAQLKPEVGSSDSTPSGPQVQPKTAPDVDDSSNGATNHAAESVGNGSASAAEDTPTHSVTV